MLHSSQTDDVAFLSGDENIVFVHGWNMEDDNDADDKRAFAETAFKRLYWQGFRGNFYEFDWPTTVDAEGPRKLLGGVLNLSYNAGEFQAFRSGQALKNFLEQFQDSSASGFDGDVHLLAHSQGNVVVAESLRLWNSVVTQSELVKNYVAMQAAISAGAYGSDSNGAFNIEGEVELNSEWFEEHTNLDVVPNLHVSWSTENEGHVDSENDLLRYWWGGNETEDGDPYTQGTESAAGTWINMFNPQDVGPNFAWRNNNFAKGFLNVETPVLPTTLEDLIPDLTPEAVKEAITAE